MRLQERGGGEENVAETELIVAVVMDSTNEHNYHQVKWRTVPGHQLTRVLGLPVLWLLNLYGNVVCNCFVI